jgi:hypothetical protein
MRNMSDIGTAPEGQDLKPALRVGPSRHGRGLFATRALAEDELIAQVRGRFVRGEDYGSQTCIELTPDLALEPDEPFGFLNHSCDPNCEFFSWDDDEAPQERFRVWLAALRPIAQGEELTIDYAWEADAAIPCDCGSTHCRGWIVDPDELLLVEGEEEEE